MEKQNSKKNLDLPLNHCITVNFRYYFNSVSITHETRPPYCAQIKAQILEPVKITFLPKKLFN